MKSAKGTLAAMPYTTRFPWKEERKIIGNPELWRFITHYCHILLNDTHQPFLGSVSFFVLTRTTLWQMVFCGISIWWWPKILGRELYSQYITTHLKCTSIGWWWTYTLRRKLTPATLKLSRRMKWNSGKIYFQPQNEEYIYIEIISTRGDIAGLTLPSRLFIPSLASFRRSSD